jgi:hypothetical protein
MRIHRRLSLLAVPLAWTVALAACGSSKSNTTATTTGTPGTTSAGAATTVAGPGTTTAGAGTTAAPTKDVSLKGLCPDTVVVQKDWWPEAEHGGLYQLVGPNPTIDTSKKAVIGDLVAHGGAPTGVKIEIRAGGGAVGFQQDTSLLYSDPSILLAYVTTDEAIQHSADFPTVSIVAPLEKNPQIIFWDPATYPSVKTIADLGKTNAKIQYFKGATYMDYLIAKGIVKAANTDGSYDGSPANFVAAQGKIASQGFGSAEPYIYQYEVKDWAKPVAYAYIDDTGWKPYAQPLATKPENLTKYADCFKKLVPMVQQAQVDYVADPAATNALILDAVKKYNSDWVYSQGVADYAAKTMLKDGLVSNGPDKTLGNFDEARVDALIALETPIFAKAAQPVKAGLKASDVVTNQFIDPSIGLP